MYSNVSALEEPILVPWVVEVLSELVLELDFPLLVPHVSDLFELIPVAFDSDVLSPQFVVSLLLE